jgi:hypothetical protein
LYVAGRMIHAEKDPVEVAGCEICRLLLSKRFLTTFDPSSALSLTRHSPFIMDIGNLNCFLKRSIREVVDLTSSYVL